MTPLNTCQVELRLAVERAEQRMALTTPALRADDRAACIGELLDALDRIEPQLGTRLHAAMYPGATTTEGM